jgi:glucose-6-phosphate isomerase
MQFKNLSESFYYEALAKIEPIDLTKALNSERVASASIPIGGNLSYNWAAMPIGEKHLGTLQSLADELDLIGKYQALLAGEVMNEGEKRLVLHHLARGRVLGENTSVFADGEEKGSFYKEQLKKVALFSDAVRSGKILGSTAKPFKTVVQIGIGGSDLGPRALYLALEGYAKEEKLKHIKGYFISNVDPDDASAIFADIDLETTLFILVSKSGTTQETLTNYEFAKKMFEKANIKDLDIAKHVVAVTSKSSPLATSKEFLEAFFIDDYIGGRYSSTSAVGSVILSIAYGYETFRELLKGAHEGDVAALEVKLEKNGALLDALIGVYLRNVLKMGCVAILPYSQALSRFAAHLQQLDMESNGKQVNRFGKPITYSTGPVIFGEPGTNGQHSFYQLLHQGTDTIPLQFIGFKKSQRGVDVDSFGSTSQKKLVANLVAQIVAFARGKDDENANKRFLGNRYSSLIYGEKLTPKSLGALLAHYENKVMFQGFVWNIISFDQEGVQLGKVLADKVLSGAEGDDVLLSYMKLLF